MRVRTLVAGVTLAMMTMVVAAPAALAAPNDQPPPKPPAAGQQADPNGNKDPQKIQPDPKLAAKPPVATLDVAESTVEAGKSFAINDASCTEGGAGTLSGPGSVVVNGVKGGAVKAGAPAGSVTITLTCTNTAGTDAATDKFDIVAPAPAAAAKDAPAPAAPAATDKAELDVPDKVLFDANFPVAAKCEPTPGTVASITSSPVGVTFNSAFTQGDLPNSIPAGTEVELTLTCSTSATDKAKLLVVDNDKDPFLDLDPNEGFREDEVDVEAYCPGTGDAQLRSNVLKEITLKRANNGNLYGETKVRDDAKFGYSDDTRVECPGDDPHDKFWVLEHRKADLDLDPAFGKRGDEIKVRVICDFSLGKLDSDVLDDIEVKHNDNDPKWRYKGTTHVVSDAKAGEHKVKIRCGDDTLEEDFFVIVDGDGKGGSQNTVYPKGAPQTGGGPAGSGPVGALGFAGLTGVATAPVRRLVRR